MPTLKLSPNAAKHPVESNPNKKKKKRKVQSKVVRIGITSGDPAGIGPEVIVKALTKCSAYRGVDFVILGDDFVFKRYKFNRIKHCTLLSCRHSFSKSWQPGRINKGNAQASLDYLKLGVDLLKKEKIQALVTAPVSKEAIHCVDRSFMGHTEYLAKAFKVKKVDMMFVAKEMKTVIVTRHLPIKDVPKSITVTKIFDTLKLTHRSLRNYFHLKTPRIAVCGLNPHAGEGGLMGREEITKIIPALKKARRMGINACGPLSADTVFIEDHCRKYDCIIAMYHDQGLIPIKTLYFRKLVNLTIGLPCIRTSPAHGTAFDIAGKNKADPSSMQEAISLAVNLSLR